MFRLKIEKRISDTGITLVALVITIIILLILTGITIRMVLGDNGIIENAKWTAFVSELSAVKENAIMKENEHAMNILDSSEESISPFEKLDKSRLNEQLNISDLPSTLSEEISELGTSDDNLYIIDKATGNGKEKTYLFDDTHKIVYKINGIKMWNTVIHSIEGRGTYKSKYEEPKQENEIATMNVEYKYGYYEPDLNGFDQNKTYVIYYADDWENYKEITVKKYLEEGKPQNRKFEDGNTYTFHEYSNTPLASTWGNVKTYANGQESWWTWIPRYAYDNTNMKKSPSEGESGVKIRFITTENKYITYAENGKTEANEEVNSPYIAHPSFSNVEGENNIKELKGIWMSKYEPNLKTERTIDDSMIDSKCYAPDMTGFDDKRTYLIKYDKTGTNIVSQDLLANIGISPSDLKNYNRSNDESVWYSYESGVWGNIKTVANGQEAWWVWIPRYAYNPSLLNKLNSGIIFVDVNNKPIDSTAYPNGLPEGYIVHPAFDEDENTHLKGIWMSKYEPSLLTPKVFNDTFSESNCYLPDITGFDDNNTYLVKYDLEGKEIKSQDLLSVIGKDDEKLKKYNLKDEDSRWYNYEASIWANVKTIANELEAWWVWIPRYAYNPSLLNKFDSGIIFVDLDNNPMDKNSYPNGLPEGYIVHPAFDEDENTHLKGIWMSKYEPSGAPTTEELKLSD